MATNSCRLSIGFRRRGAPAFPSTDLSPTYSSEVPIEQQTDPSPRPSPSTIIPDSIPETSGGNLRGHSSSDKSLSGNEGEMTLQSIYDLCLSLCAQVSDQAKEIQHLKAQIKKLKKQAKPVIKHHRAWMQSVSLKQRLARKRSSKKQWVTKSHLYPNNERKIAKGTTFVQIDPLFDEIPEDTVDHMETEECSGCGEDKRIVEERRSLMASILSNEDHVGNFKASELKTRSLKNTSLVDKAEHLEEINQNVVIRSNGQKRYFSTLMRVLSIFDRDDLNALYQLVMDKYQDEIPGGFDKVLWGDLMVMFNPDDEDKFWNSQQDWNIVSWKLHGSSGVHTLVTEAGLVIHMLVEKKYPLRKKVLVQMLKLKLESEEDSTMALELIRFVKKLLVELEPKDSDGDEEDL
ncbi:hypothetical protein Tco_0260982 [Tanacetum coccineum]